MSRVFRDFERLYHGVLPPILRDVLAGQELHTFIEDRFHHVRTVQDTPAISVLPVSRFWNASIIEVAMPDIVFIADTILDLLDSLNLTLRVRVLALFDVQRRKDGTLVSIASPANEPRNIRAGYRRESWTFFATDPFDERTAQNLHAHLKRNLKDLRRMVDDFPDQISFLNQSPFGSPALQAERSWLFDNFIMMGTALLERPTGPRSDRTWNEKIRLSHPLGMFRDPEFRASFLSWLRQGADASSGERKSLDSILHPPSPSKEKISVLETNVRSHVKQDRSLTCVFFSSPDGSVRLLAGIFAAKGELTPRYLIPAIHARLEAISRSFAGPSGSHTYREVFRQSQAIPLGLLFSRTDAMLRSWLAFLIDRRHSREAAYVTVADSIRGGCWILRTVFDEEEIAIKLRAFAAREGLEIAADFHGSADGITLHFIWLRSHEKSGTRIASLIEAHEEDILASWTDRFRRAIMRRLTGNRIHDRIDELVQSLDPATPVHLSPEQTLDGLLLLQSMQQRFLVRVEPTGWNREWAMHIYTTEKRLLGDLMPAIDSCGLRVNRGLELSFRFSDRTTHRHIFYLEDFPGESRLRDIERMVEEILGGGTTVEGLNELILSRDFNLQGIRLLKALVAFLYQLDRSVSRVFLADLLKSHGDFARSLIDYVDASFGERADSREKAMKPLDSQLERLHNLAERTTARYLRDLCAAIVRIDRAPDRAEVALKIETNQLDFAPRPRPLYEIFVYAPNFEAVHLRSGLISRGGIRWSDRVDDFRREILGLMATQRIKNTMIVPDGSKGGFVLKPGALSASADRSVALHAYAGFMESLLRLTDNLEENDVVHPPGIRCLDGNDPYLVVAADRGTATFSDTANTVAERSHFWLGDAFASGGRFGYDHKKQGITARGAWESVKSHFALMGIDPEREPIRVIGIGDMSGDVFGNGLLLSRTIRLLAAFNHRTIFIDPDPDPATSFEERRRLFRCGLDWKEYNPSLLSAGGGIFERDRADIRLSPRARSLLDINAPVVTGQELIRAILCCDADLLWNGGIGTYVKASGERHEEAGDPVNDGVRIDATHLRVRVVGEGGNLGFTTAARYEAAIHGVRLHTDAVDNSGGVDMSDHEVNLKILLQTLRRKKMIGSLDERNRWIRQLEPVMIRQVIENNRAINLAILLENRRWPEEPWMVSLWLRDLVKGEALREDEIPPGIDEWARSGRLPDPFVCNLIGWSKLYYRSRLDLKSETGPEFREMLLSRFRDLSVPGTEKAVLDHPLADDIVRTETINHVIHTGGTTFLFRLRQMRGLPEVDSIRLKLDLERMVGAVSLRKDIDRLSHSVSSVSMEEKVRLHLELEDTLFRIILFLPADFFSRTEQRTVGPLFQASLRYEADRKHRRESGHKKGDAYAALSARIHSLPDAFRLHLAGVSSNLTGALAGQDGLPFDEIERAIRTSPCQDTRELSFHGRLLHRLEEIRRAVMLSPDIETIRIWKRSLKEARRMLRDHRMNPVLLYEILSER